MTDATTAREMNAQQMMNQFGIGRYDLTAVREASWIEHGVDFRDFIDQHGLDAAEDFVAQVVR